MCSQLICDLECYLDDLFDCFKDFVTKTLALVTCIFGTIVIVTIYSLKLACGRNSLRDTNIQINNVTRDTPTLSTSRGLTSSSVKEKTKGSDQFQKQTKFKKTPIKAIEEFDEDKAKIKDFSNTKIKIDDIFEENIQKIENFNKGKIKVEDVFHDKVTKQDSFESKVKIRDNSERNLKIENISQEKIKVHDICEDNESTEASCNKKIKIENFSDVNIKPNVIGELNVESEVTNEGKIKNEENFVVDDITETIVEDTNKDKIIKHSVGEAAENNRKKLPKIENNNERKAKEEVMSSQPLNDNAASSDVKCLVKNSRSHIKSRSICQSSKISPKPGLSDTKIPAKPSCEDLHANSSCCSMCCNKC